MTIFYIIKNILLSLLILVATGCVKISHSNETIDKSSQKGHLTDIQGVDQAHAVALFDLAGERNSLDSMLGIVGIMLVDLPSTHQSTPRTSCIEDVVIIRLPTRGEHHYHQLKIFSDHYNSRTLEQACRKIIDGDYTKAKQIFKLLIETLHPDNGIAYNAKIYLEKLNEFSATGVINVEEFFPVLTDPWNTWSIKAIKNNGPDGGGPQ